MKSLIKTENHMFKLKSKIKPNNFLQKKSQLWF